MTKELANDNMPRGSSGQRKWSVLITTLILASFTAFLALNYHSHSPKFTYHSEIFADAAGYYVYLPATFEHQFRAAQFRANIDSMTGNGFTLDIASNKVITKYTYGVAMLQMPFYLLGKVIGRSQDEGEDSFNELDHAMVNIASSIYLSLGLLLMFLWSSRRISSQRALVLCFLIFCGSNLFYYTVCHPGMSHVYSFFLFALLLWVADGRRSGVFLEGRLFTIGLICGSIMVVRPLNAIFILAILYMAYRDGSIEILRPRTLLILAAGAILPIIPQLIYWQYAFGSPIAWSYGAEGFDHWNSPMVFHFLFSPNNGALTYVPLLAIALIGSLILLTKRDLRHALPFLLCFIAVTYFSSAWWSWHFGCALGSRNLVEYMTVSVMPISAVWDRLQRRKLQLPAILLAVLFVTYQLKLVYTYDGCWLSDNWDWATLFDLIFAPTK